MKIKIKPLSVNQAWKGRRYKTNFYNTYERELLLKLPNKYTAPEGKKHLDIVVGFSSQLSDVDNMLKPFIAILQKKYKFNDKDIFKITIEKKLVAKGKEFIDWKLEEYGS